MQRYKQQVHSPLQIHRFNLQQVPQAEPGLPIAGAVSLHPVYLTRKVQGPETIKSVIQWDPEHVLPRIARISL
jgi:hypothetical protein